MLEKFLHKKFLKRFTKFFVFIIFIVGVLVFWYSEKISEIFCKEKRENVENVIDIQPNNDYDSSSFMVRTKPMPWYFTNGTRYPKSAVISQGTSKRISELLSFEDSGRDHFIDQMMFMPKNYNSNRESTKIKTILSVNGIAKWWHVDEGKELFSNLKCPVDKCRLTSDNKERQTADLVLFHDTYIPTSQPRPHNQIYALYHMESPYLTAALEFPDLINWTITYRHDSSIPTPYSKWLYYDPRIKQQQQTQNFAMNKTKKVAWMVSNCNDSNGRLKYAHELQKYIQVDIYGNCGELKCPRKNQTKCFDMLHKDYKFYLAFENANCKHYITEKLFENALGRNILPIVMGAPREDYEKYAPQRSYIHVEDFKSPKDLADYLHILDTNSNLYNSYFKWKGTGEFIGSWQYLWCRICAVLHDKQSILSHQWYENVNSWWRGPGICTNKFWRDTDIS